MPFFIALSLGLIFTPLFRRVGRSVGLVDRPSDGGLKIHAEPVPLTGGIAVVLATLVGSAVAGDGVPGWPTTAIAVMLVVGVADDFLGLPPLLRLIGQLGAGAVLVAGGVSFEPLGGAGALAVLVSVPLLTNAVNLMDGQDGLAGGLALLAALGISGVAAAHDAGDTLGLALVGGLLAFLVWNRPPASVFLGNGGAYAVGCVLAVLAASSARSAEGLLAIGLCLTVFGMEVVSTVLRRGWHPSMLAGDRSHAYDLLAARLASRERSTIWMWAGGAATAVAGVLVARSPMAVGIAVVIAIIIACAVAVRALWRGPQSELRRSW